MQKTQCIFITKTFSKLGTEGKFFYVIEVIKKYSKHKNKYIANILSKMMRPLALRSATRKKIPTIIISI